VFDEPSVAFYLARLGFRTRERIGAQGLAGRLAGAREPVWIVVGRYTRAVPGDRRALAALDSVLQSVAVVPLAVRDLRLLDDVQPDRIPRVRTNQASEYRLEMFRWSPPSATRR
jgi:hypothetical protein